MHDKDHHQSCREKASLRYSVALMGCLAFVTSYGMRTNVSVAIVDMVNSTQATSQDNECKNNSTQDDDSEQMGEFNWDPQLQGIVLSSFFWGYLLPQTVAGRVAEKYGPKYVMLLGGSISTLMTFLGPVAARFHVACFIVTRFICGLGLSVYTPCCLIIISKWAHPSERSFFASLIYSGCSIGNILAMPVSGLLCQHAPDGGWPWTFYFFGILSAVWLLMWTGLVYNSPEDHPFVTDRERAYLQEGVKDHCTPKKSPPVPWKKLWSSKAVWAIFAAYFGNAWGNYTMLTELPSYMSNILGFNIQKSGTYSCMPYVAAVVVAYSTGFIMDFLIKRKVFKTVIARKVSTGFAMYVCGVLLLGVTFLNCETMAIYTLLVLAIGLNGASYSGHLVNAVGLSPNFAGTIQGIGNSIGTVPGIISPYITGVITDGQETRQAWSIVFYISFAVMVFFGTIYLILAEDSLQYWNDIYVPHEGNCVLPQTNFERSEDLHKVQ